MFEIKEVKIKEELKRFISFYTELYRENKQVPFPLHFDEFKTLSKKNPARDFCKSKYWLACSVDGKIVGRIAAIINKKEQEKIEEKIGRIGWFDFIDNEQVSSMLIEKATEWFKGQGVEKINGPLGFTDLDRQGLLIEGHQYSGTMSTLYNYSYYEKHFDKLGFVKNVDWVEYEMKGVVEKEKIDRISRIADRSARMHNLRTVKLSSKKEIKKMASSAFNLINDSYTDLFGFVELTQKQIKFYTEAYFDFINPKLISFVVDESDKLVGVAIAMNSLTAALQKAKGKLFPTGFYHLLKAIFRKNETVDLCLIAVAKEYQSKGINALLIKDILKGMEKLGIKRVETNINLETNENIRKMWRMFDANQIRRRRCYSKVIG